MSYVVFCSYDDAIEAIDAIVAIALIKDFPSVAGGNRGEE